MFGHPEKTGEEMKMKIFKIVFKKISRNKMNFLIRSGEERRGRALPYFHPNPKHELSVVQVEVQ